LFLNLLEGVSESPQRSLAELPLLSVGQSHQVLQEWNAAALSMPRPREARIAVQFQSRAAQRPDAIAVTLKEAQLSYGELEARTRHLAGRLQQRRVGPESRVGVLAERSLEMVIAILSVVRSGAAYLPLDPAAPEQRLAFLLSDSGSEAVMVAPGLEERISTCSLPCLRVGIDSRFGTLERPYELPRLDPAHLACLIYTSGSTGLPKGVAVTQQEVVSLACQMDHIDFGPATRMTQTANSTFDGTTFELWGALLNGSRLAITPRRILLDPHRLSGWLREEGIDTLFLTTALFHQVAASLPGAFRTLANVIFGGEAVETDWVRQVLQAGAPRRLINGYGPAECTSFSSWHCMTVASELHGTVPIGRGVIGRLLYVLDKQLNPVPPGVWGELYIGGRGLARGYIDRPGLTGGSFIPDSFSGAKGGRLYRTGDRVAWNLRGELEFLGRLDGQLKMRGFRIEPGEIESVLREHPQVEDALVAARGESSLKRQLAAYLIASKGSDEGELRDSLRSNLKERLPGYMVPSAWIFLDSFPLTPQGKLDRRALPDPGQQRSLGAAALLPRDALELELARIWEEVLEVGQIGLRDDFFELGGHSLMAVQLMSRIEQAVGRKLPLGLLFEGATVERLAEVLRSRDSSAAAPTCLVALQPEGRLSPFFCVHPAGGSVFRYLKLARLLGRERPFYGLQAPELDSLNPEEILSSVEDLAALYLGQIRSVQPQGPYLLGGHSFGGLVAFEMARQLEARGEEAGRLILIDSQAPLSSEGGPINEQALYRSFAGQMGLSSEDWPAERLEQLPLSRWAPELLKLARHRQLLPSGLDEARLQHLFGIFRTHAQAQQSYRPQPVALQACLLKAGAGVEQAVREWGGWLSGGVEAHPVPGDHFSLLEEPHVQQLADRVREILERGS
ncbi:MAG: amino acid adenylation domain-containing protein, partial [Acidobacteriota bacterium]